jgi:multiple sugar transport system substrate-binding protein
MRKGAYVMEDEHNMRSACNGLRNAAAAAACTVTMAGAMFTVGGTAQALPTVRAATNKTCAAVAAANDAAKAVPQPRLPAYNKDVTIQWWTRTSNPQGAVAEFNCVYPNIHVQVLDTGGNSATIAKVIASEKAGSGIPDLVLMPYHYFGQMKAIGAAMNVAKYADPYAKYFSKWYWQQASGPGGAVYALPEDAQPEMLFYRADLFKKAALPYIPPTTWAQYYTDAVDFHKKYPKIYFSAYPTSTAAATMATGLFQQAGAEWSGHVGGKKWTLSYTSAKVLSVANYWQGLVKVGAVAAEPVLTTEFSHQLATNQFAAMVWGTWFNPILTSSGAPLTDHWTMANIPQWSSTGPFVTGEMGGSVNFVPARAPHPQAAVIFDAWLQTSRAGLTDDVMSAASGGRGEFPADIYAGRLPAFEAPQPQLHGQVIGKLYSFGVKHINFNWTWNPWEEFVIDKYSQVATQATSGSMSWKQALQSLQSQVAAYASGEGYSIVK